MRIGLRCVYVRIAVPVHVCRFVIEYNRWRTAISSGNDQNIKRLDACGSTHPSPFGWGTCFTMTSCHSFSSGLSAAAGLPIPLHSLDPIAIGWITGAFCWDPEILLDCMCINSKSLSTDASCNWRTDGLECCPGWSESSAAPKRERGDSSAWALPVLCSP